MNRSEPQMITGVQHADDYMHAPKSKSVEEELAIIRGVTQVESHQAAPKLGEDSVGIRRFRSDSPKFRLQIRTSKPHQTSDGYWIDGESQTIQFKPFSQGGGIYYTEDPVEIKTIEECTAYGVSLYDLDAMNVESEKARMDYVEDMVAGDAKLLERLKAKFGKKDFVEGDGDDFMDEGKQPKGKAAKGKR